MSSCVSERIFKTQFVTICLLRRRAFSAALWVKQYTPIDIATPNFKNMKGGLAGDIFCRLDGSDRRLFRDRFRHFLDPWVGRPRETPQAVRGGRGCKTTSSGMSKSRKEGQHQVKLFGPKSPPRVTVSLHV